MKRLGLSCPLYLTQNDGTLTTAAEAARLPIRTFSSGATNSMRGASYLAGIDLKRQEGSGKLLSILEVLRRMWVYYYQVASLDKQQRLSKLLESEQSIALV
ncbi:hypothetical protein BYT27DRAFT_7201118 [Phlegmacium glaucopus]|nr:hypothetical protein BYT27DRAFT_7201118 [Phlegmacium glaucopus]